MTTKHTRGPVTPLAWRVGDAGHTVYGPQTDAPSPLVVGQRIRPSDARYIVRACNAHEALLAALEAARIALTFYREDMARQAAPGHRDYPYGIAAEKQARAAIKQAKGE